MTVLSDEAQFSIADIDMTNLTEEERSIIRAVMKREREDDLKNYAVLRRRESITNQQRNKIFSLVSPWESLSQHYGNADSGSLCPICRVTKFVSKNAGYICTFCQTTFCSRCGYEFRFEGGELMWICNSCKQKKTLFDKFYDKKGFSYTKRSPMKQTVPAAAVDSKEKSISGVEQSNNRGVHTRSLKRQKAVVRQLRHDDLNDSGGGDSSLVPSCPADHSREGESTDDNHTFYSSEEEDIYTISAAHSGQATHRYSDSKLSKHEKPTLSCAQVHSLEEHITSKPIIMDSGIDTASSQTIQAAERKNKPITWKLNSCGTKISSNVSLSVNQPADIIIGNENSDFFSLFGIELSISESVGHPVLEVEKIKLGKLVDFTKILRTGDEIISWNGQRLKPSLGIHKIKELLLNSISNSTSEIQVLIQRRFRKPAAQKSKIPSEKRRNFNLHGKASRQYNTTNVGKINLRISHEQSTSSLCVFVAYAKELRLTDNHKHKYLICRLLLTPDPTGFFYRAHTKPSSPHANDPSTCSWNQKLVFRPLTVGDLLDYSLLVSIFEFDKRYILIGEVCIDLTKINLQNESRWFNLTESHEQCRQMHAPEQTLSTFNHAVSFSDSEFDSRCTPQTSVSEPSRTSRRCLPFSSFPKHMLRTYSGNRSQEPLKRRQLPQIPLPVGRQHETRDPKKDEEPEKETHGKSQTNKNPVTEHDMTKRKNEPAEPETVSECFPRRKSAKLPLIRERSTTFHTRSVEYDSDISEYSAQLPSSCNFTLSANKELRSSNISANSLDACNRMNVELNPLRDRLKSNYSDSALADNLSLCNDHARRKQSVAKALVILGLTKRSRPKRHGFHRSEEIGVNPELSSENMYHKASSDDIPRYWSGALKLPHEQNFISFVEDLGPGQLVGRQVLGSPVLGEIQLSLRDRNSQLEVEVIRGRNIIPRHIGKVLPAPFVKLYLLDGKNCVEKQQTKLAKRTLEPLYEQTLLFHESYFDKSLQVSLWGDYGKLGRKVFMGICQIDLGELHLNDGETILGWYKLFSSASVLLVGRSSRRRFTHYASSLSSDEFHSVPQN